MNVMILSRGAVDLYPTEYFLGTTPDRGNFSLLEIGPKEVDRTNTVIDYFGLKDGSGGVVLEVGCGTAPFSRLLHQSGLRAYRPLASDITRAGVDLLSTRDRPPFTFSSADSLAVADESLAGIVEWDVLEHIPNPEVAIAEAHRALRPGGFMHVVCPNPDSWLRAESDPDRDPYRRDKTHVFPPIVTPNFLYKELLGVGFEVELFTRGFPGSEGRAQTGLASMKPAREDPTGTHLVAFATKR